MSTQDFKRKLSAILSADEAGTADWWEMMR
jgi:hypothetical protein